MLQLPAMMLAAMVSSGGAYSGNCDTGSANIPVSNYASEYSVPQNSADCDTDIFTPGISQPLVKHNTGIIIPGINNSDGNENNGGNGAGDGDNQGTGGDQENDSDNGVNDGNEGGSAGGDDQGSDGENNGGNQNGNNGGNQNGNNGGDQNDNNGGTQDNQAESQASRVVALVNEERAKAGLRALTIDDSVEAAANVRAEEIVKSFSHTRPDGRNYNSALTEAGANFFGSGENIAWGQQTPEAVMNAWMNSEGHRANILNKDYTSIGVGVYTDVSGTTYWTQLFTY